MRQATPLARYLPLALAASLAACGGSGHDNTPSNGNDGPEPPASMTFAQRCAQLAGKDVAPGSITSTEVLEATSGQPQTCVAMGEIVSSPTSTIQFRADLPEDASWNTKLVQMGGGGYNGVIRPPEMIDGLAGGNIRALGYAVISSDSGHQDPTGDFKFALGNPSALDNFAFNAHPQLLKAGLATLQALYGAAPSRKYFVGISTGGREALLQAQRFADSYDGIVAGMPVVDYSIVNQKGIAIAQAAFANGGAGWLNPAKVKLFDSAQLAACDAQDGLADGVIANTAACQFDAQALRCPGGADSGDTCLSDPQLATVELMRTRTSLPAPVANGIATAAPLGVGGEASALGWSVMQLGMSGTTPASVEFNFANGYLKYGVTSSPTTDLLSYVPGTYAQQWLALSDKVNATNPDLGAFADKGGKLILFHGTSDHLVPPAYSSDYYASVVDRLGQARTDSFMRFHMLAGVGHTGSGYLFNALAALDGWVEKGQAPQTLISASLAADNKTIVSSRPVCRNPAWARYNGSGDVNSAASFVCATS